jgi:hypothetical protein
VDLATNAVVDIVEGITITENIPMNFGVLVQNSGDVVLASTGATTDATNLIIDATNVAAGDFSVDSTAGSLMTVNCTAGTMPTGLTLASFTVTAPAVADAAVPQNFTMGAGTEGIQVGATLSVDGGTVAVASGVNLPYTVSVTFQ